jgi:hypothetical protein
VKIKEKTDYEKGNARSIQIIKYNIRHTLKPGEKHMV